MDDLINRLKGIYNIAINDGLGHVNNNIYTTKGKDFHRRVFPTTVIQLEAAEHLIFVLDGGDIDQSIIEKLLVPQLFNGKEFIVPIHQETVNALRKIDDERKTIK